jgi:hypothetical protein
MNVKDLTDPKWLYLKAVLFLALGVTSAGLLASMYSRPSTLLLIVLTIWSFSRFYYFCFYVIERYIDPSFRFSGLLSVIVYVLRMGSRNSRR